MNRNRTPHTSNENLLKENRRDQRQIARNNVRRHDCTAKHARNHHHKPTAKVRRQVTDSSTSTQSANLPNDSNHSRLRRTHARLVFQESRVQVLTAVADAVEPGHDYDHVYEQDPVLFDGVAGFSAKGSHVGDTGSRLLVVEVFNRLGGFGFAFGFHY
jgi:hypothetical protein